MNILYLIVFVVAFGLEPGPLPFPPNIGARLGAVAAGSLGVVAFAAWLSQWTVLRLLREPGRRAKVFVAYNRLRLVHTILSIAAFGALLRWVNWNGLVRWHWRLEDWPVIDELVLILPFVLVEAISFAFFYTVEETHRASPANAPSDSITRWQHVDVELRHQMGVWLCASLVIVGLRDAVTLWLPWLLEREPVAAIATGVMSLSVLTFSPLIIRYVWRAVPLGAGLLREELLLLSKHLGFRCKQILVWRTHHGIANAAVTGLIPQIRYVLLSDMLLDELPPRQLTAVFGHEVGHIRHHHLTFFFGFVCASVLLISFAAEWLYKLAILHVNPTVLGYLDPYWEYAPIELLLLLPYFGIVFGFLSRRFERQADLFGSRVAAQAAAFEEARSLQTADSVAPTEATDTPDNDPPRPRANKQTLPLNAAGTQVFIDALEKVAELNGIPRKLRNWRHGSIAARIAFLEQVRDDPALGDRYDRFVTRLRWLIAILLATGIALLWWLT